MLHCELTALAHLVSMSAQVLLCIGDDCLSSLHSRLQLLQLLPQQHEGVQSCMLTALAHLVPEAAQVLLCIGDIGLSSLYSQLQ